MYSKSLPVSKCDSTFLVLESQILSWCIFHNWYIQHIPTHSSFRELKEMTQSTKCIHNFSSWCCPVCVYCIGTTLVYVYLCAIFKNPGMQIHILAAPRVPPSSLHCDPKPQIYTHLKSDSTCPVYFPWLQQKNKTNECVNQGCTQGLFYFCHNWY